MASDDTKRGRGRPPIPDDERRSVRLKVQVTESERAQLDLAADLLGESISDLLRRTALATARRAIAKKSR